LYACIGPFGPWTLSLFSFIVGMSLKLGGYMQSRKPKILKCKVQSFVTSIIWCTCLWTTMKALMHSKNVGDIIWGKILINIDLVMHGQVFFGPIIKNLVCDHFQ
jgi:hypothetical protein